MEKSHNIPDGIYGAVWGGYILKINGYESLDFKTNVGIKTPFHDCHVTIQDGELTMDENKGVVISYVGRTLDNIKETPEERAKRLGVPFIPPVPQEVKDRDEKPDLNPIVSVCGECGRDVRRVEMYSCGRKHCPIQPKATM